MPLLALAGATDALLILHSKELLAVYMTGNTTKLGGFMDQFDWAKAGQIALVIGVFVLATVLAAWGGKRRHRARASLTLLVVGILLALAAPSAIAQEQPFTLTTVLLITAAMGVLNQVRDDEPGVTFVTGSLVKLGRCLAAGKLGSAADALLRWLCFLIGAVLGALLDRRLGGSTFLLLGALCLCAALAVWRLQSRQQSAHA